MSQFASRVISCEQKERSGDHPDVCNHHLLTSTQCVCHIRQHEVVNIAISYSHQVSLHELPVVARADELTTTWQHRLRRTWYGPGLAFESFGAQSYRALMWFSQPSPMVSLSTAIYQRCTPSRTIRSTRITSASVQALRDRRATFLPSDLDRCFDGHYVLRTVISTESGQPRTDVRMLA